MRILLATLHAKYVHASLALPCIAAFCRDLQGTSFLIREWTVNEPREQILRHIMSEHADVIGFSCYIWNIESILLLAADIKKIAPDTVIVLGGPEASFGVFELMTANPAVDFVVRGEGEAVFRELLAALGTPGSVGTGEKTSHDAGRFTTIPNLFFRGDGDIAAGPLSRPPLPMDTIPSPFAAGLVDLEKTLIYHETSRGCPFSCAFCLSSVEGQVRSCSMERIRQDLLLLMHRKVPQVKLVDRTFNYDAARANRIWSFILEQNRGSHFHFEIAADLLTDENLELLQQVPPATFRFEIGVQSASQETLEQVGRKSDLERVFANIARLRDETRIELHLDLVAGLPGEDYGGFLASLQRMADLRPDEIQVEPLKVLKGSPMREIARREGYRFSDAPPYTILRTPWLSFDDICRIATIGRLLDLFYNHGHFSTAFRFMERLCSTATLLDRMAAQVAAENLSGMGIRRVYELFARLAAPLLSESDRRLLHDALFFDYCHSEMPLQGKLPAFVTDRTQECVWPGRRDLGDLELPEQSRVKAFRFTFAREYRADPWREAPSTVTFVYASQAGQGLRVMVR